METRSLNLIQSSILQCYILLGKFNVKYIFMRLLTHQKPFRDRLKSNRTVYFKNYIPRSRTMYVSKSQYSGISYEYKLKFTYLLLENTPNPKKASLRKNKVIILPAYCKLGFVKFQ